MSDLVTVSGLFSLRAPPTIRDLVIKINLVTVRASLTISDCVIVGGLVSACKALRMFLSAGKSEMMPVRG